ncbi:hypothetical protein HG531_005363 [Fusarium graminearum]|nr:hypothetical protein HG531_005363 [Fusarium graminearum]
MLNPSVASALGAGVMYDLECGTSGFLGCSVEGPATIAGELLVRPCPGNLVSGDAVRLVADFDFVSEATRGFALADTPLGIFDSSDMASLRDVLGPELAAFQGAGRPPSGTVSQGTWLVDSSFAAASAAASA